MLNKNPINKWFQRSMIRPAAKLIDIKKNHL